MKIVKRGQDAIVTLSTVDREKFYIFRDGDGLSEIYHMGDLLDDSYVSSMRKVGVRLLRGEAYAFLRGLEFSKNNL